MAHLMGTERGTPGLERTLYKRDADPMPEAWEILTKYKKPQAENSDVRITIDHDLQAYVASQLEGKKGAIVVINPQTGDVLAMYSNPSYTLSEVQTLEGYLKLEGDKANKPLLSRATREYYTPGSTFKTLTMISAFRAGKQDFLGFDLPAPDCYTPFKGSRPICDAGGSCEICSDNVPIREAFKVSSNQYFAELANFLGRERMGETARLIGISAVDKPEEALTQGYFPEIWNTSDKRIANSISPARSTIVIGKSLTLFDFGLEGMGQGLASQQTPFQMALIASVAGNLQGRLMKPKIEADIQPQVFSQVLNPPQAAQVREIMSTVTEEAGGTGGAVRSALAGTGIMAGGKTGTAEKDDAPKFNPKTGERMFVLKKKKDTSGNIVEYKEYLTYNRTDGWFICIAPLENPQVAIAVVIEDIGSRFGGQTAAPVAANVILKARNLGLLGDKYKPKAAAPATKPPAKKKKPQ
jgi:cell division protein FtsI/penicillin-binding protein 2